MSLWFALDRQPSAGSDLVQDLVDASFVHSNGATILTFSVNRSYLTQYADGGSAVKFVYAHGEPNVLSAWFGYHGPRRWAVSIPDFVVGRTFSPPSPPQLPPLDLAINLTPRDGVRLRLLVDLSSNFVYVDLYLNKKVRVEPSHPIRPFCEIAASNHPA